MNDFPKGSEAYRLFELLDDLADSSDAFNVSCAGNAIFLNEYRGMFSSCVSYFTINKHGDIVGFSSME